MCQLFNSLFICLPCPTLNPSLLLGPAGSPRLLGDSEVGREAGREGDGREGDDLGVGTVVVRSKMEPAMKAIPLRRAR